MTPLPIQPAKIHPPLLRHDVLSRERLNGWLDDAVGGRVALVIAEAGFGKTTLLADWARHTKRATAWYRLEPDDRDWLAFIRHLVATGREIDPAFGPETYDLLMALGPGGPTRDDLIASLAREMAGLAASLPNGLSLLFDDYHSVDGSPETDPVMKALLERTGPGFSLVLASRATPSLAMGRLRARGAVARIDGDELCFDVPETVRLFRDAYHQPLEADVVVDLIDRTEGWAALLSLVHTGLDEAGSAGARALVEQLSATRGDLYDYLAEEVIEGLPDGLEQFLTGASILTAVVPEQVALFDPAPLSDVSERIGQAEALGLLMRPDRGQPHRFHPLVRDFLRSRLDELVGVDEVRRRHRSVGRALAKTDWGASAWHYAQAGDAQEAGAVIDQAVPLIIASGQFDAALRYLDGAAGATDRPGALILRSRLELGRGNLLRAQTLAQAAVSGSRGGPLEGTGLLNLAGLLGVAGFEEAAVDCATQALACDLAPSERLIAKATIALWDAANEGDLEVVAEDLRILMAHQSRDGHRRHSGVSGLNLAAVLLWAGDAREALAAADSADRDLVGSDATSVERVAALAIRARALAHLGETHDLGQFLVGSRSLPSSLSREEASVELAGLLADFGATEAAALALASVDPEHLTAGHRATWRLAQGQVALRSGDVALAAVTCRQLLGEPSRDVAGRLRAELLRARTAIAAGAAEAKALAQEVGRIAEAQRSRVGLRWSDLLSAIEANGTIHEEVLRVGLDEGHCLSMLAEELTKNLHRMSSDARARIETEAQRRPDRWREALRRNTSSGGPSSIESAQLLSVVGSSHDAEYLRGVSQTRRELRPYALALTRRLAPTIYIEDLGAVRVIVGGVPIHRVLRRKVLGLLCFLSSRQGMAATRDEALDALWPELGPDTAANSLHQTIYFLRRVFEPWFREGLSAGYVHFDGEVVSLSPDLIGSASRDCWSSIRGHSPHDEKETLRLLNLYRGKYALDFAYDDWASSYRENLHAAVLARTEAAISASLSSGHEDLATRLAHAVLAIDPTADAIELALLRIYKASGRHAAAAEQYAHYAAMLRSELGADPPSFDEV